jgi:hypothetical protein
MEAPVSVNALCSSLEYMQYGIMFGVVSGDKARDNYKFVIM